MGLKYNLQTFNNQNLDKVSELTFSNGELHLYSLRSVSHDQNEDSYGFLEIDRELKFFFVADGMGGHQGGAKASELICKVIDEHISTLKKYDDREFRNIIIDAIEKSNAEINNLKIGAGSTFSAIQITESGARFFNSGDSMGLHLGSRGKLKHKVIEHSPLGFAIEAGVTTREQSNIADNIISNALGFSPMWLELSEVIPFTDGDLLSVFTDGVLTTHKIDEISDVLIADLFQTRLANLFTQMTSDPNKFLGDDTTIMLFKLGAQKENSTDPSKATSQA
ncbi:PP2C family serine/threonine-protein phosphatase [Bacteriovorax sp. Seq25_V]|uniref:PP2C family protein-serine/threonine phosphatase n=1 Tax=Bacteriovorax sp. Seq25_V TaxID=1201288 RepID=UPI000389EEC4|nr:protein phosphatase 2C domain-containing protein [Bacteriovorax sp. Seq25_V]EQC46672.1 stage II sporulation protein E [Bacteriovorax sp. Seq25_V]